LIMAACQPQILQRDVSITISVDGQALEGKIPAGSTVQEALDSAGVTLGELDRLDPPAYSLLSDGSSIRVTRVREEFETQQAVIPFDHQELRNESLPQGETRLLQSGANGLKEITVRHVYEDDIETSSNVVRVVILQASQPQIIMVGVQSPFSPLAIPGKLAYVAGGNAWIMEGSTANRRPVVTTGDLDGRILSISPSGNWLLFSRKSTQPAGEEINTLWVVNIEEGQQTPIDLEVSNVVHFGSWIPDTRTVVFSTVEPRQAAPGWQANNDLYTLKFTLNGPLGKPAEIVEANAGGIYGWWGSTYVYSPDGKGLAYTRPDGIGLVDMKEGRLIPLLDITPLQTRSDWAWIPGLAWGLDSATLYVVTHAPAGGLVSAEESPYFDLNAISLANSANVLLDANTGMFAYPTPSPLTESALENGYQVAFLEAVFPEQSDTSRYRLVTMDRDGSNRSVLFPEEGLPGLEPQIPAWAPQPTAEGAFLLAILYQGNLWMIDTGNGQAYQITGDGLMDKVDWK
jgi:hypothetical protein